MVAPIFVFFFFFDVLNLINNCAKFQKNLNIHSFLMESPFLFFLSFQECSDTVKRELRCGEENKVCVPAGDDRPAKCVQSRNEALNLSGIEG